jgi:hypothetical protein
MARSRTEAVTADLCTEAVVLVEVEQTETVGDPENPGIKQVEDAKFQLRKLIFRSHPTGERHSKA